MSTQQSSISSSRKCSSQPTLITSSKDKVKNKLKNNNNKKKNHLPKEQQQSPKARRSPLHDYLNIPISSSISRTSNLSSSTSSSISIDAPTGCLNFFSKTPLNTRSKNRPKHKFLSKNPKSAPNPLQFKENKGTHKSKKTPAAQKVKSLTDFGKNQEVEEKCYSGELCKFPGFVNTCKSDNNIVVDNFTPAGKFLKSGNGSSNNNDGKSVGEKSNTSGTPPVQSSLSPEIQCGSSLLVSAATPSTATCYGAGHVVSGITDRRKCRPRGTLIVGSSCSSGCPAFDLSKDAFDGNNDEKCKEVVRKSRPSFVPLPAEASMSWNLSPSQEEGGSVEGEHVKSELDDSRNVVRSSTKHVPSLPCRFDSNMFRYTNYSDTSNHDNGSGRKTRITLLSPAARSDFQGVSELSSEKVARPPSLSSPCATPVIKQEERTSTLYNFTAETSPFSLDSLGSENVIQTPKSDSAKERRIGKSWLNEEGNQTDTSEYEIYSISELLQQASLSPWSETSLWDPLGIKYKMTDLTSPSKSIDLNQLHKDYGVRASCISNSTLEDVSQSHMRISWRDGLVSRIFEMDDLDSCRLLSDEENEADGSPNILLKSHPTKIFTFEAQNDDGQFSIDGLRSPEFLDHEVEVDRKGKSLLSPNQSNSCAESICTDGGGLVASGDADWTLCYKNHLFEE